MTRPLKVGIQLPVVDEPTGATPRWQHILVIALRAEELGFDSIWVPDHLLFRRPERDDGTIGVWEGWSLLAALAARTRHITLGTLVVCTAFRNPILLAHMARTVAEISGDRLILGLGAGWHDPEFRAFGYPIDRRVARFEEAIRSIAGELRDTIEATHPHHTPGRIPIMVGARGDQMLRLAARYADLWNTGLVTGSNWPDVMPTLRARVDAACSAVGRVPATLTRTINPLLTLPLPGATPTAADDRPISGDALTIAAALSGFADAGISHLQLLLNPTSLAALEAVAPVLALLDNSQRTR